MADYQDYGPPPPEVIAAHVAAQASQPDVTDTTLNDFMTRQALTEQQYAQQGQQRMQAVMQLINQMQGPPPTPPQQTGKFQRVSAGIGDSLNGLAQALRGWSPVHGSGRGAYISPPVPSTHFYGDIQAHDEQQQTDYENQLYRRGVVSTQMAPSLMNAIYPDLTSEKEVNANKLTAAGISVQKMKANKPSPTQTKQLFTDVASSFVNEDGSIIKPTDPQYQVIADTLTESLMSTYNMPEEQARKIVSAGALGAGPLSAKMKVQLAVGASASATAKDKGVAAANAEPNSVAQGKDRNMAIINYTKALDLQWSAPDNLGRLQFTFDKTPAGIKKLAEVDAEVHKQHQKTATDAVDGASGMAMGAPVDPAAALAAGTQAATNPPAMDEQAAHVATLRAMPQEQWKIVSDFGRKLHRLREAANNTEGEAHFQAIDDLANFMQHTGTAFNLDMGKVDVSDPDAILHEADDWLTQVEDAAKIRAGK